MVLAGKVALVSGASRGIGRGAAVALAQAGADVAINYNSNTAEAEETAAEVRKAGRRAMLCQVDVSNLDAVEKMFADVVAEFGKLDIAVSNAVFSDREPFYEADMKGFRKTIEISMFGALHIVRTGARQMIKQGHGGSIVVISSPHADIPIPRAMAYNMSKAANDQMARTAAIELIDFKIRVNILHPGWVDTPGERKYATEDQIAQAAPKLPWGRMGTIEEMGRGVVFLCDPASEYITGSTLKIDGGNTLPWWAARGMGVPT